MNNNNKIKLLEKDGLCGAVDKNGNIIVPCKYSVVMDFREGFAPVMKDGLWGFVNMEGKEVIPCTYKAVRYFQGGYSPVKKDLCGIIDKMGNEVIPCEYEGAYNFNGNYALVKKNGLWGGVNKNGELVVGCKYKDESLDESYYDEKYQISNKELRQQIDELQKKSNKDRASL